MIHGDLGIGNLSQPMNESFCIAYFLEWVRVLQTEKALEVNYLECDYFQSLWHISLSSQECILKNISFSVVHSH